MILKNKIFKKHITYSPIIYKMDSQDNIPKQAEQESLSVENISMLEIN